MKNKMMNKMNNPITDLFKKTGLALVAVCCFQSCDLDRETADYINFNESFSTLADMQRWDNGIYSTLRGKLGGGYVLPQEIQADMLNAHASYRGLYGTFHGWDVKSEDETLKSIYHSYYAALVDVNIVLTHGEALVLNAQEKLQQRVFLGNAHLARAFYYFNLAMRWGMPYREASAATDLCVPLITQPFSLEKPARATNKQVFSLILDDLKQAEAFLAAVPCQEGSEELTADAVRAFRARVFLYMGRMPEALKEARGLIESGRYPLIPALANGAHDLEGDRNPFIQMWHYDNGKEQIWQPYVEKPNEVPTLTELYGADLDTWSYSQELGDGNKNFNKPTYLPTGTVMYDLFASENDRRIPAYFELAYTTVADKADQAMVYVIAKFKGNPKFQSMAHTQWGGYVPNGITAPKPFRIAEQYLIAAEAAYATNEAETALKMLNDLKASRGLPAFAPKDERLEKEIRDERARELAFEGFRLWDLRRWHQPIAGRTRQGTRPEHVVGERFFAEGYPFDLAIAADNPKFIWGFPKDEVNEINKNIRQNPGW